MDFSAHASWRGHHHIIAKDLGQTPFVIKAGDLHEEIARFDLPNYIANVIASEAISNSIRRLLRQSDDLLHCGKDRTRRTAAMKS